MLIKYEQLNKGWAIGNVTMCIDDSAIFGQAFRRITAIITSESKTPRA